MPLSPYCSVVTTKIDIPSPMSAEAVQHTINVVMADVQAQKDKTVAGNLRVQAAKKKLEFPITR